MTSSPLKSPCIKVCAVDGETGWCLGCGRTLVEIGGWTTLGESGRDAVLDKLEPRLKKLREMGKLGETA